MIVTILVVGGGLIGARSLWPLPRKVHTVHMWPPPPLPPMEPLPPDTLPVSPTSIPGFHTNRTGDRWQAECLTPLTPEMLKAGCRRRITAPTFVELSVACGRQIMTAGRIKMGLPHDQENPR